MKKLSKLEKLDINLDSILNTPFSNGKRKHKKRKKSRIKKKHIHV